MRWSPIIMAATKSFLQPIKIIPLNAPENNPTHLWSSYRWCYCHFQCTSMTTGHFTEVTGLKLTD